MRERVESVDSGDSPAGESPAEARWLSRPQPTARSRHAAAGLARSGRKVRGGIEIEVENRTLKLTNLDKVLYPKVGFTKSDLISYYAGDRAGATPPPPATGR